MTTSEQVAKKIKKAANKVTVENEHLGIKETYWLVEGDVGLTEPQILEYAVERVDVAKQVTEDPGSKKRGLVAITKGDQILRWSRNKVLSYCVWKPSFASDAEYQAVVAGMADATDDWASICNVKFEHVAAKDTDDQLAFGDVVFPVLRQAGGGSTIAMAFFPDDIVRKRIVWIFDGYFAPDPTFEPVGVLRHELGHVLGFRHEHIRPEAPDFFQPEPTDETFNLSEYDPQSVMHYLGPGVGNRELTFTDDDRTGSRHVYGGPDGDFKFAD